MKRRVNAFTLTEVIVVLAIIALIGVGISYGQHHVSSKRQLTNFVSQFDNHWQQLIQTTTYSNQAGKLIIASDKLVFQNATMNKVLALPEGAVITSRQNKTITINPHYGQTTGATITVKGALKYEVRLIIQIGGGHYRYEQNF